VQGPFVAGRPERVDPGVQPELVEDAEQQQCAEDEDLHPQYPPVHRREQLGGAVNVLPVQEEPGQGDRGDRTHGGEREAADRRGPEGAAVGGCDGAADCEQQQAAEATQPRRAAQQVEHPQEGLEDGAAPVVGW
jgi:hypothetical protein